jgi:SAM-dependent methyltransferase
MHSIARSIAGALAKGFWFSEARRLWECNCKDYFYPLSQWQKFMVASYIILADYSIGQFPPKYDSPQETYEGERKLRFSMPGLSGEEFSARDLRKPFWQGGALEQYLFGFVGIVKTLNRLGVRPPSLVLDLGCGTGWVSEFLALMQYRVVGVDLSPDDIQDARKRIVSAQAKDPSVQMDFVVAPMESVSEILHTHERFDAIFVFEALHHAHDWRAALASSFSLLKPGGWLLICNEPNLLHTGIAYRGARITNTHEIGLGRGDLLEHLKDVGFNKTQILKNRIDMFIKPHWIASQKSLSPHGEKRT